MENTPQERRPLSWSYDTDEHIIVSRVLGDPGIKIKEAHSRKTYNNIVVIVVFVGNSDGQLL